MLSFLLAIFATLLGVKAFTPSGLPLTRQKNLTGGAAKVVGAACILFGALLFVDGIIGTASIIAMLRTKDIASRGSGAEINSTTNDNAREKDLTEQNLSSGDARRKPTSRDPALDVADDAFDESRDDHELAGKWEIVSGEIAGRDVTTKGYYEFKGNHLRMVEGPAIHERTFELDPNADPKRLDSRQTFPQGTVVFRAIYRVDGNMLTISDATPFRPRPDRFVDKTTIANDYSLCTLRRIAESNGDKAEK